MKKVTLYSIALKHRIRNLKTELIVLLVLSFILTNCSNEDFEEQGTANLDSKATYTPERHEDLVGQTLRIENAGSGLWARISGSSNYSDLQVANQSHTWSWTKWIIEEVEVDGAYYYRFKNESNSKRFRPYSATNTSVYMAPSGWTGSWTQWMIVSQGNNEFLIVNRATNTILSASTNTDYTSAQHVSQTDGEATLWSFRDMDGNLYEEEEEEPGLHAAFAEFDEDETDIYLDGDNVVIETTGYPNHTSYYWGEGHELYLDEDIGANATPSTIPGRDASAILTVSADPQLATSSTSTQLGTIGISVSGAAIFNDQEGNGPLNTGVARGLDYSGGHIGPSVYHYHLEPKAFTDDDENLVGVLADGFFIYGRKCNSTGTYPTDLDVSGGHTHTTQHSDGPEYHYHIKNELYLDQYYLIFAGDYQGTPSNVM
ncbi:YHYH protein [Aquimarina pacifica]|uniref:YHYH protein n=1 Tax=Aquimarina pacifica TaxID=1296415 RepID=UPI000472D94E|nr:YHYH protein [Aquimarina pacifica]